MIEDAEARTCRSVAGLGSVQASIADDPPGSNQSSGVAEFEPTVMTTSTVSSCISMPSRSAEFTSAKTHLVAFANSEFNVYADCGGRRGPNPRMACSEYGGSGEERNAQGRFLA